MPWHVTDASHLHDEFRMSVCVSLRQALHVILCLGNKQKNYIIKRFYHLLCQKLNPRRTFQGRPFAGLWIPTRSSLKAPTLLGLVVQFLPYPQLLNCAQKSCKRDALFSSMSPENHLKGNKTTPFHFILHDYCHHNTKGNLITW